MRGDNLKRLLSVLEDRGLDLLAMAERGADVTVLLCRRTEAAAHHPLVTWVYHVPAGAMFHGHYFAEDERQLAERDFVARTHLG